MTPKPHSMWNGDGERFVLIGRAIDFVPLSLYDEIQKLAESAMGDLMTEHNGLLEQYQTALDLLARVQPELAPNWVEANDLRKKFGLGGAPAILEDIATFLSNPASRLPQEAASGTGVSNQDREGA